MGHFHEHMPTYTFRAAGTVVCSCTKVRFITSRARLDKSRRPDQVRALLCRKFHRAMLQVVDKTLGVSFCKFRYCLCLICLA